MLINFVRRYDYALIVLSFVVTIGTLAVYFGNEDNQKIADCIESGKSIELCHLTINGR